MLRPSVDELPPFFRIIVSQQRALRDAVAFFDQKETGENSLDWEQALVILAMELGVTYIAMEETLGFLDGALPDIMKSLARKGLVCLERGFWGLTQEGLQQAVRLKNGWSD